MPLRPYQFENVHFRSRGYLPHWELDDSYYSITFRLSDSLPQTVIRALKAEMTRLRSTICGDREPSLLEREEIAHRFVFELDRYLDRGYGACHLRRRQIAQLVAKALQYFDGERYALKAWCVMPNHVHAVIFLEHGADLARVVHSWKSFTGKLAKRQLGLDTSFWQREYFDRIIRGERDLETTIRYVLDNPANAGLRDWEWVGG